MIEVAMATDDKYAQHAAAVVHSLLQWNTPSKLRFNFVHGSDSTAGIEKLGSMIRAAGAQYRAVPIPATWLQRLDAQNYYGLYAWLRMLLPELLPDCPRVLYLDSDVIVCDNLEELWSTDLQDKLLGAVMNPFYPHQKPRHLEPLGITDHSHYFNSGMLLMNTTRLREEGWVEKLVRFAAGNRERILFPDQDTLNAVLGDRWLPLHPRYNAQAAIFDLHARDLPFPPEVSRQAQREPAIIHFNSSLKPWLHSCQHPRRQLYWQHLRQTPWRNARPQEFRWRNLVLRLLPYRAYRLAWKYLFARAGTRTP